ncbi:hypothetical protein Tco_0510734 [Tanacetum coccineum]
MHVCHLDSILLSAYAPSMPQLLSLPLSMARDDSDGLKLSRILAGQHENVFAAMAARSDDDNLPFTMRSSSTPVSWLGSTLSKDAEDDRLYMGYFTNENSYCRFDVGLHEAIMSLGVGKFKDDVICTWARQLTEVAAMADVLRFATLLSLIYVGVLSLPAQRRSSRLWQWDQITIVDYKLTYLSGTSTTVLINGFHTLKGDKMASFGTKTNVMCITKDNIVACQAQMEKEPEQEYILIPLCTTDLLIFQGPKDCEGDAEMKPTEVDENEASDKNGKHDQEARIVQKG